MLLAILPQQKGVWTAPPRQARSQHSVRDAGSAAWRARTRGGATAVKSSGTQGPTSRRGAHRGVGEERVQEQKGESVLQMRRLEWSPGGVAEPLFGPPSLQIAA